MEMKRREVRDARERREPMRLVEPLTHVVEHAVDARRVVVERVPTVQRLAPCTSTEPIAKIAYGTMPAAAA